MTIRCIFYQPYHWLFRTYNCLNQLHNHLWMYFIISGKHKSNVYTWFALSFNIRNSNKYLLCKVPYMNYVCEVYITCGTCRICIYYIVTMYTSYTSIYVLFCWLTCRLHVVSLNTIYMTSRYGNLFISWYKLHTLFLPLQ